MSLPKGLSDDQLMERLYELIQRDHELEAELISHLGEVDARRLYLGQACPSMFHYCVHVLHFAEGVAYKRIAVARAARKFPEVLAALASREIHLTAASLIAPHLETGSAALWVALARHATAQQVKQRIADRKPKADVATSLRRAPALRPSAEPVIPPAVSGPPAPSQEFKSRAAPATPEADKARSEPLGAERYCVRFVADERVHQQLQELRALLRHSIPDGDVAKILARAVGVLLEQVLKKKIGSCSSPRSPRSSKPAASGACSKAASKDPTRHIPVAIRREVWARDGGRCSYKSAEGWRCGSAEYLEFHHRVPWARCREHSLPNISLRCHSHNQYEAELDFGVQHMARFREQRDSNPVGRTP
ncbi:MAG: hypothetical protein JRG94_11330 [Deltaproteobacteria bacterium]|nr:hypothetical protein [Deltaproteobacteria bacterium]